MEVIDSRTAWEDRAFYFSGQIVPPVVAGVWRFRSEEEYEADNRAEETAMNLVRSFARCIEKRGFLLLASYIGMPTAVRTKKGVLWNYKAIRQLQHIAFENECENGRTRLAAVVDLSEFNFECDSSALLNWGQGMIVLSDEPIEAVAKFVGQWISRTAKDVLAYDYDAVAASLQQNAKTGVLRYLPPSSSRSESVVIVANENFFGEGTLDCIDAIT